MSLYGSLLLCLLESPPSQRRAGRLRWASGQDLLHFGLRASHFVPNGRRDAGATRAFVPFAFRALGVFCMQKTWTVRGGVAAATMRWRLLPAAVRVPDSSLARLKAATTLVLWLSSSADYTTMPSL